MNKIFMVEDDEIVVEIYRQKIADEGYSVAVAIDGETAFDRIVSFKPDLLLLDMMLPGVSGIELLKKVRSEPQFKDLPIIAFSSADSDEILKEAIQLGATRGLSKSEFTPSQIVARITETLVIHSPQRQQELVVQTLADWVAEDHLVKAGRVLVVEDDPLMMTFVKDILEQENYEVSTAVDGREAYKILNADNNFVAGIFDVNVPMIEGIDLVRHMKTEKRLMSIPVMIMTSDEGLSVQAKSFSAGAAVFLVKPFTRASLKTMFRTIVKDSPKTATKVL